MKKIYIILPFLCAFNLVFSQYTYFDVHIKGESTLHNFNVEQSYTISKTGGDWGVDVIYSLTFPTYYGSSSSVINNTQHSFSYNLNVVVPNGFTKEIIETIDNYGNDWLTVKIKVPSTYTSNSFNVKVENELMESLTLNLNNPIDPYPLTNIPPTISSTYLSATSKIDSDNPSIISTATSITSGCNTEFSMVNKLAEWIKSNIAYVAETPSTASTVLSSKQGDCDGMSNLMIAFCRSLGIPARINVGCGLDP